MKVEVKFEKSGLPAKVYTGKAGNWPDGVYQCEGGRHGTQTAIRAFGTVVHISGLGKIETNGQLASSCGEKWYRVSDDPRIASITFAGSMNYPDGKPEGGEL